LKRKSDQMKHVLLLTVLTLFLVAGCINVGQEMDDLQEQVFSEDEEKAEPEVKEQEIEDDDLPPFEEPPVLNSYFDDGVIRTLPDGTKYIIHPSKLQSGGPPKDGIPSIDNPKFVSVDEADEWIKDNELVMGIEYKGTSRAYPLQIMVWHEIVNDEIAGDPILITWCPLCGSAIAYESTINGEEVEFGTSGKLYNSNLIMYDRKTDSYWTQIGGKAVIGELTGMQLTLVSIDTVPWRDWKKAHPESEVLSQDTGHTRAYGTDPYGGYYEEDFLWFPVDNTDKRIHSKTVIFGIEVNGVFKAYKEDDLVSQLVIEDTVNGVRLKLERTNEGIVTITNLDSGEEVVKERDFWFAWYAFHPKTELYES